MGSGASWPWGQSESFTDSGSGGKQTSSPPDPPIFAHSSPQLPPVTSPLWVNLGTKLSTTHRHTQHQSSHTTLREGTTGTGPWSGLEVTGRGGRRKSLCNNPALHHFLSGALRPFTLLDQL